MQFYFECVQFSFFPLGYGNISGQVVDFTTEVQISIC